MKKTKTLASGFPVMLDGERAKYVAREVKYEETIESLRRQLAEKEEKYSAVCEKWHQSVDAYMEGNEVIQRLEQQLAASHLREQQLREILGEAKPLVLDWCNENGGAGLVVFAAINKALAIPQETTALEAVAAKAGEVMRKRALVPCKELSECEDNSTKYRAAADFCGIAIRALPGVTLDDIK